VNSGYNMDNAPEPEQLTVPSRVHIVPMGFEDERISQPPIEANADKVVLLKNKSDKQTPAFLEAAEQELREEVGTVTDKTCNIFSLYDSIGSIAEIIGAHDDDEVYVNLATGSKVTAIGGMIACMATNGIPYYVKAADYGHPEEPTPPEHPYARGVKQTVELPHYHIDKPSVDETAILEFLVENDGEATKGKLIDYAENNDLEFLTSTTSSSDTGKYRRLESKILGPLRKRECVAVHDVGRNKVVKLTQRGQNTYRAFAYQLQFKQQSRATAHK